MQQQYDMPFFQFLSYLSHFKRNTLLNKRKIFAPNLGLEPTTLNLRISCYTDWASRARWICGFGVCRITVALPSTSDRYVAWEEWDDSFDQTRTYSSFRDELFKPRCDRCTLLFIFAIILYTTSYTVTSIFEFKEKTSSFKRMQIF